MKTPREQAGSLAKALNLDSRDGAVDEIEAQLAAAHAAGREEVRTLRARLETATGLLRALHSPCAWGVTCDACAFLSNKDDHA